MEGHVPFRKTTRTLHPGPGKAEAFLSVYFSRKENVFYTVSHSEDL